MQYTFETHGDGLWGCEEGRAVTITGFSIDYYFDSEYNEVPADHPEAQIGHVTVLHDSDWDVYTDTGFREAARFVTGIPDLDFTEQGMQEPGIASMEV
jgi:hypothetical protein